MNTLKKRSANPFRIRPIRKSRLFERGRHARHVLYWFAALVVTGVFAFGLQGVFARDVSTTFSNPLPASQTVDSIEFDVPNEPSSAPSGELSRPKISNTNIRGFLFNQAAAGETPEANPLQFYDYTNMWGRVNVMNGLWNTGGTVTPPPSGAGGGSSSAATIPVGTLGADILKFSITAAGDLAINSIAVSNTGTSTVSDFVADSIKLYDDAGEIPLGTSNFTSPATFSGLTVSIANGTTKNFTVKASISQDAVKDRTIIAKVSSIAAKSGTRTVSVALPTAEWTNTIAAIPLTPTAAAGTPAGATLLPNTADRVVSIFKLGTGAGRSITLDSLTVTKTGNAKNAELTKLKLFQCSDGTVASCTVALGTAVANLTPNTGTGTATAAFSGLNFTVAANTSTWIGVKLSTAVSSTGGKFKIGIASATDLTISPNQSTTVDGSVLPLYGNEFIVGPSLFVAGSTGTYTVYTGKKQVTIGLFTFQSPSGKTTISPNFVLTHIGTAHTAMKNIAVFDSGISDTIPVASAASLSTAGGIYFAEFKTFTPSPWNVSTMIDIATRTITVKADLACGVGVGSYVKFDLDPAGVKVNGNKTGLSAASARYNIATAACTAESGTTIPGSTINAGTFNFNTDPNMLFQSATSENYTSRVAINSQPSENLGKLLQTNVLNDLIPKAKAIQLLELIKPFSANPVTILDSLSIVGNVFDAAGLDVQGYIINRVAGMPVFIGDGLQVQETLEVSGDATFYGNTVAGGNLSVNGNLAINGTSDSSLKVDRGSGEADITFVSGVDSWQIGDGWAGATGGTSSLYFYNTAERMSINSAGNLKVNGNIKTNATGQIGRFYAATEVGNTVSTYTATNKAEVSLSCPAGDSVVGCSGHMYDPENDSNAVYAGAWQSASGCIVRALPKSSGSGTSGTSMNATLYAHTWCFSPDG